MDYRTNNSEQVRSDKMGMVDFLVSHIAEEANDAGTYMTWAAKCTDPKNKDTLNAIANQELQHQHMLVEILANMAREGENADV